MRHGQDTGAHFRGHAETGEIGGAERIFCKPFIGYGDGAAVGVRVPDANTGKEGAGQFGQEKEFEFDRVVDPPKKGFLAHDLIF